MKLKSIVVVLWVVFAAAIGNLYAAYDSLGANVDPAGKKTVFSIWSPDASNVSVFYQENPQGTDFKELKLSKTSFQDSNGRAYTDIYSGTVGENLNLCEYYFVVNENLC